ncbi:methyltransferase domain-containing protein [Sneathiella limimaris]|uniref:methyltransferase domain-containing protein n=1 Tax=Sneathiella limimaris TaxID=1964213 RepID=UPI00146EEAC6|nr:methyltransferase domain-containing protein [Sneathiella limimaris]
MGADAGEVKEQPAAKVPLKERLKLWWEGYELQEKRKLVVTEAEDLPIEDDGPPTVHGWSLSRRKSVVTLFGDGMTRCVPDTTKQKLTNPLGINKTLSVVELGSGLGGFAHWVNEKFEAYVDGYEEDQDLVNASNEMTKMAGNSRFLRFHKCDFEEFDPKPKSANVAYASEALFTVKNKAACFARIHSMMKNEGQFMMSDYMVEGVSLDHPALLEWYEMEPKKPHLLEVQEARTLLTKAGFEVSIAEDTTDEYRANVLKAFAEYAQKTSAGAKSGHLHDWVLKEGELWTARVKAMESGALKVFRIYARVPPEIV